MHIHILGICGTFMGGIALLAREAGHEVSGSDANVYPPMSTQLETQGIRLQEGFDPAHLEPVPDAVVVGNVMSRGNPMVEAVLNRSLPYTSGPQWLYEQVLRDRWVLAVAGTHGKTTTSSMLAWILDYAGLEPGFLIGGVPENFGVSARLGGSRFFVVEADEYDTAFFDKRSKFVHYRPRTLVMNNLEFDHADIFPDLAAIQRQFHHLVRMVPGEGLIVRPAQDPHLDEVLAMGCWTPVERFSLDGAADFEVRLTAPDGSGFELRVGGERVGETNWDLLGAHNVSNALAAIAAARHVGVPPAVALEALARFRNVKRRLELYAEVDGVRVYDDFAHHPTAIRATLGALRAKVGQGRILAILEPRSNTMRLGVHAGQLSDALSGADRVFVFRPADLQWDLAAAVAPLGERVDVEDDLDRLLEAVLARVQRGDHILIMSNGGFGGLHGRLAKALAGAVQ
ncbi:MAG: UDP-N-acetylmuramate:L-alanyl-gamma-D-glutamyl-meso-diaminopimelate ligase [Gammaproteobacteria bacterium]